MEGFDSAGFWADIDGSGTADLLYFNDTHINIYPNRSGRGFGDAIRLDIPQGWTPETRVLIGDMRGTGTDALLLIDPGLAHVVWFDLAASGKPHLLSQVENGIGGRRRVTYGTSTEEYLRDKQAGKTWQTRVPLPIHVVKEIETEDRVAKNLFQSNFAYHEGFYDMQERRFNGFRYVESRDAGDLPDASAHLSQAPTLTKTWFHTGALNQLGQVSRHLATYYYKGDAAAADLPDTCLDTRIIDAGNRTLREAYGALTGRVLRRETFSEDETERTDDPFQVVEYRYAVRLLQAASEERASGGDNGFASFDASSGRSYIFV